MIRGLWLSLRSRGGVDRRAARFVRWETRILSLVFPSAPCRGVSAEPLEITITAEGFTQAGETPFGAPGQFPDLLGGVHSFGLCARVEVRAQ